MKIIRHGGIAFSTLPNLGTRIILTYGAEVEVARRDANLLMGSRAS